MQFSILSVFALLGTTLATSLTPSVPLDKRQDQQISGIEVRIADVASIESAIATANTQVANFSAAVAAFDGSTPENSLAFLTGFSQLSITINTVSQTILISGLLNVNDSAAVYPDVALFTTSLTRAVTGLQTKVRNH